MLLYDTEHIPNAQKIDWHADLNDPVVRDYIDAAAALDRYSLDRILALAKIADPGIEADDVADAGRYLDRLDDARFAVYGLGPIQVAALRERLASWPR